MDRALCLNANVKYADAFTVVSTALQRDPANVDLAILAGVTKAEAGDPDQASRSCYLRQRRSVRLPRFHGRTLRLSTTGWETPRRRPMPEPRAAELQVPVS